MVFYSLKEAMASDEPVRILDLSRQNLVEVPDPVWEMSSLEELYLNHNQLHTLSPKIGNLSRLKTLDISANRLIELPRQLCRLKKLQTIRVTDNPLAKHLECLDNLPNLLHYEILPAISDSQRTLLVDSFFSNGNTFIFATKEPIPLNAKTVFRKAQKDGPFKVKPKEITLRILVNHQGYYLKHKVISSTDAPRISQIEAVLPDLAFTPAYEKDEPISFWVNIIF